MVENVDLIWIERLHTAHNLRLPAQKCIVDIDDLDSIKISRRAETTDGKYLKWALTREASKLSNLEQDAPSIYAAIAVCSDLDAKRWTERNENIWVVPNGADDSLFDRPPADKLPGRIVFVGTLSYWANVDAIMFFMREIFPDVLRLVPSASISIVGREPSDAIRSLHDGKTVFVHGDVADVSPFVQQANLSVVPLRAGGGTRLKILESLALGTAVVSTSIGAEGLALIDGEHISIADDARTFSKKVAELLSDSTQRERIASQGKAQAAAQYRWSAIGARTARMVQALAKNLLERRLAAV